MELVQIKRPAFSRDDKVVDAVFCTDCTKIPRHRAIPCRPFPSQMFQSSCQDILSLPNGTTVQKGLGTQRLGVGYPDSDRRRYIYEGIRSVRVSALCAASSSFVDLVGDAFVRRLVLRAYGVPKTQHAAFAPLILHRLGKLEVK